MSAGTKFGEEEFKNAKKVAKALGDPGGIRGTIIEHATRDMASYDPNLEQAMKDEMNNYLDNAIKVINEAPVVKADIFSEESTPSDSDLQRIGERLAVVEYGAGAIMRGLYAGTLTQNEVDAFREFYPQQAMKMSKAFLEEIGDPENMQGIPQSEKELLGMIIGVNVINPEVAGFIQDRYKKDEEEKPGPKPNAKWVEGRFPGTQLSGSYAVEKRRQSK